MFIVIFWAILFYLAYRFIFGLVIPVSKAASQMKAKIREMQEEQQRQQGGYTQQHSAQQTHTQKNHTAPSEDYIEFEEVK